MTDSPDQMPFPTGVSREEVRRIVSTPVSAADWQRLTSRMYAHRPFGDDKWKKIKPYQASFWQRIYRHLPWPLRAILAPREPEEVTVRVRPWTKEEVREFNRLTTEHRASGGGRRGK